MNGFEPNYTKSSSAYFHLYPYAFSIFPLAHKLILLRIELALSCVICFVNNHLAPSAVESKIIFEFSSSIKQATFLGGIVVLLNTFLLCILKSFNTFLTVSLEQLNSFAVSVIETSLFDYNNYFYHLSTDDAYKL